MQDVVTKRYFVSFESEKELLDFTRKNPREDYSFFSSRFNKVGVSYSSDFIELNSLRAKVAEYKTALIFFVHNDQAVEIVEDSSSRVVGTLVKTTLNERDQYPIDFTHNNVVYCIKPKLRIL